MASSNQMGNVARIYRLILRHWGYLILGIISMLGFALFSGIAANMCFGSIGEIRTVAIAEADCFHYVDGFGPTKEHAHEDALSKLPLGVEIIAERFEQTMIGWNCRIWYDEMHSPNG